MAVLCEGISVVVPTAVIAGRIPGGVPAYAAATPNRTFLSDGRLTRVGFLEPGPMQEWVAALVAAGLRAVVDGRCADLAVVDQVRGLPVPCDWLATTTDGTVRIAWLADGDPGDVVVPDGWSRGQSAALVPLDAAGAARYLSAFGDGVQALHRPRTGERPRQPVAGAVPPPRR
jgi:hypothetical protein